MCGGYVVVALRDGDPVRRRRADTEEQPSIFARLDGGGAPAPRGPTTRWGGGWHKGRSGGVAGRRSRLRWLRGNGALRGPPPLAGACLERSPFHLCARPRRACHRGPGLRRSGFEDCLVRSSQRPDCAPGGGLDGSGEGDVSGRVRDRRPDPARPRTRGQVFRSCTKWVTVVGRTRRALRHRKSGDLHGPPQ